MCLLRSSGVVLVDPALELVRAGPAARPLLLVRRDRPGAGNAADRAVARLVERVVGNLVHLDVGPDALLVPVGERVHLPDAVPLRPLELRRLGAARRLVAADARDPGVVRLERREQRLDLADVTAPVGVALPEVRPLLAMLLGDREHRRREQVEPVALDEPVASLVRLAEEELRVELDDRQVEPELGDHVHERRRLLLPRAGEAQLVAVLLVDPDEELLGAHRLEIEIRKCGRARQGATPPSACRRAGRAAASRAGSPRRAGCSRG